MRLSETGDNGEEQIEVTEVLRISRDYTLERSAESE